MGQQDTYLSYINWSDDLSEAQRIDRGPLQPAFAVGKSEVARAAVTAAQQLSRVHHLVYAQVKEQAVFAIVVETEGLTIREIAGRTGIPKSEVGRIVRRFTRDENGRLQAPVKAGPMMGGDLLRDAVRATWDEASSTGQSNRS